jgi:hypothetical protein
VVAGVGPHEQRSPPLLGKVGARRLRNVVLLELGNGEPATGKVTGALLQCRWVDLPRDCAPVESAFELEVQRVAVRDEPGRLRSAVPTEWVVPLERAQAPSALWLYEMNASYAMVPAPHVRSEMIAPRRPDRPA